jgi:hypothetical protein
MCPPIAAFLRFCFGLWSPHLHNLRAKSPIVSSPHTKYSRFWETRAGDRARSALRGVERSQLFERGRLYPKPRRHGRTSCWLDPVAIDPGCVKTSPSRECAELFSLSSSPNSGRKHFGFQIDEIETEFPHADWTQEFSCNQDPKRTVDPSAILTARASFRSCSRFPICLNSQTGAGLFAPIRRQKQRASDAWSSLTLSDASCGSRCL